MKRLLLVAASMLCLIVFFFACSDFQNLSEPKKVVVKPGDAKYSIPFGGYSVAFDDYINVSKLQENLDNASGDDVQLRVWDYQDQTDKTLQQFIVEYPITSISLNPDDYLGDITDFLQNFKLSDDGDSQISIPINDVFKQVSESLADCELPVDVPLKTLNDAIDNATGLYSKEGKYIRNLTIPPAEEKISLPQVGFDYGAEGFIKQAVIENGAFTIACELPSGWSGVTATVSLTVSGAIEETGFKNVNKGSGYLIRQEADLAGKTIDGKKKDITIEGTITFECNDATIVLDDNGNIPPLTLVCTSQIKKIRDAQIYLEKVLSNAEDDLKYDDSVSVSIPEYVKNCKIVKLDMQAAVDTNLAGVIKQLYIAPKIASKAMGIDASDNTDYSDMFADDGGLRIIKDVDDGSGWNGFYLVQNGVPPFEKIDLDVKFDIRGDNYNPARPDDYTDAEDTITITSFDVTSDTDYYLKPTFGAPKDGDMLECDKLELQIDSDLNQNGSIETGLSIGDMLDNIVDGDDDSAQGKLINDLIDAIELQGIEGYLYVTAPKTTDGNPLESLPPITGNVTARCDGGEKPLFEIADSEKSLIRYSVPSFASLADENRLITKDTMFTERYYSAKTAEGSLCEIINKKVNNLAFEYDISFGSSGVITLDRAQIRALQEAAKDAAGGSAVARAEIAMTIAVVLPLKLNITKDIVVDNIMTLAGDGDEDFDVLGGEDSDSDYSEYIKYTEALKSLTLYYQCKNPFDKLSITAALSEKNGFIDKTTMDFDNNEHKIFIYRENIDKILKENSFKPEIAMTLEKGEVSVKRNTELKMNAALVIETNNDAEIAFEL